MLVGVRAGNGSMCLLKGKSVKNQAILVEPAAAQGTTAAGSGRRPPSFPITAVPVS